MPYSCYVPNCKTGCIASRNKNKREGKKNPSMFRVPSVSFYFNFIARVKIFILSISLTFLCSVPGYRHHGVMEKKYSR